VERVSRERLGDVLPQDDDGNLGDGGSTAPRGEPGPSGTHAHDIADPDAAAADFVRFCYRRRAVAWPELYDEMCAVAARGDYQGMSYEQLERLGIRFALTALPRLADLAARVIAEERSPEPVAAAVA
jgi:hypothetical protein